MEHLFNPEDSFALPLRIFKLFCVWPSTVKNPLLRFIYSICGYGFQLFYVVGALSPQIINVYLTKGDLKSLVESSFFTFTCIVYTAKLGIFFFRRKKIETFFKRLHQPIFAPKRKEHLQALKNYKFIANVYAIVFFSLPQITCAFWILAPLVDTKKATGLLFTSWYPFDTIQSPNYEITYFVQVILLLNTAAMNSMMDVLILNFYLAMLAQLEILRQNFKLIADVENSSPYSNSAFPSGRVTNNERINSSDTEEETCDLIPQNTMFYEKKNLKEIYRERIVNSTEHYEAILTFLHDITELFQVGILFQVGVSCFIICVTCFELTVSSPKTLHFYVVMQYQLCMLIEVFSYTWRGNEIMVKSSELKDAVYESAWTSIYDKEFRKSLYIIMSRMQVPVKLRVGRFFLLTAEQFLTILSSAYSFYVLLKQVQSKKN